jgi:hypothetical protein
MDVLFYGERPIYLPRELADRVREMVATVCNTGSYEWVPIPQFVSERVSELIKKSPEVIYLLIGPGIPMRFETKVADNQAAADEVADVMERLKAQGDAVQ